LSRYFSVKECSRRKTQWLCGLLDTRAAHTTPLARTIVTPIEKAADQNRRCVRGEIKPSGSPPKIAVDAYPAAGREAILRHTGQCVSPLDFAGPCEHTSQRDHTGDPSSFARRHSAVKNVVIMPPDAVGRDAAIQPLPRRRANLRGDVVRDVVPRTWQPGLSIRSIELPQFERFPMDSLPPGDIQIILVTERGDRRYTVRAKDRDRLR
jgi:hypothetical protein